MDIITIISQTTVPIIFISAIGLLTLTYQNRYGRVKDSVYTFQKQKIIYLQQNDELKADEADKILSFYQKEAKLIKNAMLAAFISILFIGFSSFLIMINGLFVEEQVVLEILLLITFALAVLSLVISVTLILFSFVRNMKTLNYEFDNDSDGIRFGLNYYRRKR